MMAKGTFAGILLAIADLDGVFAGAGRRRQGRPGADRAAIPRPRWVNSSSRTLNARHHRTAAIQTEVNCDETADRARQGAWWAGEPSPTPPAPVVGASPRPITDNPEAGRTILRSRSGALEYVVHRAWAVVERPLGARSQLDGRSQRGGGSQCRRGNDNTRTSQT
jgi:hypothetical protein